MDHDSPLSNPDEDFADEDMPLFLNPDDDEEDDFTEEDNSPFWNPNDHTGEDATKDLDQPRSGKDYGNPSPTEFDGVDSSDEERKAVATDVDLEFDLKENKTEEPLMEKRKFAMRRSEICEETNKKAKLDTSKKLELESCDEACKTVTKRGPTIHISTQVSQNASSKLPGDAIRSAVPRSDHETQPMEREEE